MGLEHFQVCFSFIQFYICHLLIFIYFTQVLFLFSFFFNFLIIFDLIKGYKNKDFNFLYFFSILSFIFVNVAFYRIAEHGTDRSAQILLILIFISFFKTIYFEKEKKIN